MDEITIGLRLRTLRRWRGMTLAELAGQAGMSTSYLSMAERGLRALDRRSFIASLAAALQVSETELIGRPHLGTDHAQAAPHAHIPALRTALETNSLYQDPVVERARPVRELASLMAGPLEAHRRRYDFITVGQQLPDLIDELHYHLGDPADEADQHLALQTLVEAYMCAAGMARSLGHPDLGHIAASRADDAAVMLGDPIARGKAAFSLIRPSASNWSRVKVLAARAADRLQPHVQSTRDMQVLGMLTLNAALASAATLDGATAEHWPDEADRLATHVPDNMTDNWQAFGRTNVAIWRITVGVEYGEAGAQVADKARAVDEEKLHGHAARRACFLSDVGRGLARDRRTRREALTWFRRAEDAAPQRVRNDAKVHESIAVMLEQAKVNAGGRELRGMASRMGIPH
ncbi:helix-turn-helix domain-containing protein [Nonomuraea typhae]|uniref:Helix-turn-helix domain-containing protein n=1 Tax=Nonomuraea typhae TaxID=2603600 RepID=A0ABW7ZAS7_9ACTN